jgi:hypothetical protein
MSWTHVHLALNHLPVIGLVFVLCLLAAAVWRGNVDLLKASYWATVILALVAWGVYLTGEPAEEMVEHLSGFSESLVEQHERAALIATIGLSLLGIAALVGLFYRGVRRWYPKAVLLGALLVTGLMIWTANLGGQIRHTEIRAGAQMPSGETEALHD